MEGLKKEIKGIGSAFVKHIIFAIIVGVVVGFAGTFFDLLLHHIGELFAEQKMFFYLMPVGGLIIVFLYRILKLKKDPGTNGVISSIHSGEELPVRMAPLIFIATCITHLVGGSAGREGAALQLGGSLANGISKITKVNDTDRRILIMCGMSAGFTALFGTPLAATVFAMEVIRVGVMNYTALVPCALSALIAKIIASSFGLTAMAFDIGTVPSLDVKYLAIFAGIAVIFALAGVLFCVILHQAHHLYEKFLPNPYIRIIVASGIIIGLTTLLGTWDYTSTGGGVIANVFAGTARPEAFILKMVFTALALGAGFKGGEIVPSFFVGATLGFTLASLFGLPTSVIAACGMVGVFCSVTNAPIAAILIGFEIFGFSAMPYFLITAAITFIVSGYFSLYKTQKFRISKEGQHFVDRGSR